ncbi:hypothetical protein BC628DRAFT_1362750 [Trametes gibbosa]|nr:hypothetical protein BC628DRAFT_1362750 [Trametes gibbosa]
MHTHPRVHVRYSPDGDEWPYASAVDERGIDRGGIVSLMCVCVCVIRTHGGILLNSHAGTLAAAPALHRAVTRARQLAFSAAASTSAAARMLRGCMGSRPPTAFGRAVAQQYVPAPCNLPNRRRGEMSSWWDVGAVARTRWGAEKDCAVCRMARGDASAYGARCFRWGRGRDGLGRGCALGRAAAPQARLFGRSHAVLVVDEPEKGEHPRAVRNGPRVGVCRPSSGRTLGGHRGVMHENVASRGCVVRSRGTCGSGCEKREDAG